MVQDGILLATAREKFPSKSELGSVRSVISQYLHMEVVTVRISNGTV